MVFTCVTIVMILSVSVDFFNLTGARTIPRFLTQNKGHRSEQEQGDKNLMQLHQK